VTEPRVVARAVKTWADQRWPAEPDESGAGLTAPFNASSQGAPLWNVYRVAPAVSDGGALGRAGWPGAVPVLMLPTATSSG
jgi:hypothetical protein